MTNKEIMKRYDMLANMVCLNATDKHIIGNALQALREAIDKLPEDERRDGDYPVFTKGGDQFVVTWKDGEAYKYKTENRVDVAEIAWWGSKVLYLEPEV